LILWRCQKAAALKKERKIVLSCLIISYAAWVFMDDQGYFVNN
jgi:hypothetical protein